MKEFIYDNRIYYRINEFKEGRVTLVFVHGVSGSSSAWWPYEKIFQDKYNIVTYDIRGHGLSKKYPEYDDYEIPKFAQDLRDIVSFLKIKKFVLVSNSFGCLIALEYLKMYRESVEILVLTSPEAYLHTSTLAKIVRPALSLLNTILKEFSFDPKPRGQVDYSKHPNSTDWDVDRNIADMKNTTPRVHFFTLRQSLNLNQEYYLDLITVPTLVMHGKNDTMVPIANAEKLSNQIKNSYFIAIPNVDHNTAHNAVEEMSSQIEFFIDLNSGSLSK